LKRTGISGNDKEIRVAGSGKNKSRATQGSAGNKYPMRRTVDNPTSKLLLQSGEYLSVA